MESDKERLEGGIDDTWFHDDIDGEFDDEWRAAIKILLVQESERALSYSKIQH